MFGFYKLGGMWKFLFRREAVRWPVRVLNFHLRLFCKSLVARQDELRRVNNSLFVMIFERVRKDCFFLAFWTRGNKSNAHGKSSHTQNVYTWVLVSTSTANDI